MQSATNSSARLVDSHAAAELDSPRDSMTDMDLESGDGIVMTTRRAASTEPGPSQACRR